MMKRASILMACLMVSLAGCTLEPTTLPDPLESSSRQMGSLDLKIHWPERYRTASIPEETNALVVQVKQSGNKVAQETVQRLEGTTEATASLLVSPGSGYAVEIYAFKESTPDPDRDVALAFGSNPSVSVISGRVTPIAITLDNTTSRITSLSPNCGRIGDTVIIRGKSFGANGVPLEVSFNGLAIPVTQHAQDQVSIVIPPGATTGKVTISANGFTLPSDKVLWVSQGPTLSAAADSIASGTSLTFAYDPRWVFKPDESITSYSNEPQPVWSSSNGLGTLSNGVFTSSDNAEGSTVIEARLGDLLCTWPLSVSPVPGSSTDQQADGTDSWTLGYSSLNYERGQTFKPSKSGRVTAVSFPLQSTLLVPHNFKIRTRLYPINASTGDPSSVPTAEKTVTYAIGAEQKKWLIAVFDTPVDVTQGVSYALTLTCLDQAGDEINDPERLKYFYSYSSSYEEGTAIYKYISAYNTTWAREISDLAFKTFMSTP